jgi:serine/threonine-protein kinase
MTPALIAANHSTKGKTLGPRINRHLRYKSPEQCLGLIFDARADIFTVGSIMYEMMNYKPPATTSGISNILWKQLGLSPEPSRMAGIDCPAGMREIIMHCLEKSVHDRYQSMEELRTDLELVRRGKRPRLGCRLALRNPFSKI